MTDPIVSIVIAVFASSGFWAFLTALIQKPQIREVSEKVDMLAEQIDKQNAVNARTRILRFDDELYNRLGHSQEYFIQILAEIDDYKNYCANHPEFENNRAVAAIDHIAEVYKKCRDEHKFL